MVTYKAIRSDTEVLAELQKKGIMGESYNDVLRRLLNLPPLEKYQTGPKPKTGVTGVARPTRARA